MPREIRSKRSKRAALSEKLRAQGWTWAQIARRIAADEHINMRVALRLAHDWTQESAARRWNELWPPPAGSPGMTDKRISYWETWPITGNEPALPSYKRLARLYQCDIGDLVEDGNFSHLDEAAKNAAGRNGNPAADEAAVQGVVVSPGQGEPLGGLIRLLSQSASMGQSGLNGSAPYQRDPSGAYAPVLFTAQESERYCGYLVQVLSSWADTVNRRELLRSLGLAASLAAASESLSSVLGPEDLRRVAKAIGNPARIDAAAVDHIQAVLWHVRRQDDMLGPQTALNTALSQRTVIESILTDCPPVLRPRLLSMLSLASNEVGWLSFDMGDHTGASFYFEQARRSAHEARDSALGAQSLCLMSHLAMWQGQPRLGVDHALAAQGWASQTGDLPLKAYTHQVAARAYAAEGQASALAELDTAEDILGGHNGGVTVAEFNDPAQLTSDRGWCHLLLGDHEAAAASAQTALAEYDRSYVRNRAFTELDLGRAYVRMGDADEAAKATGRAVGLVACNRSPRLLGDLRVTVKEISTQADTRAVRELRDKCAAAGITGPADSL